ncbi:MAG TPA: type II toxin-antitoxin system RelE/ParE family toxin [Vitreimonas sp.]|uniref:type II toxin-antitoxin system RelE/ParE family toxin n=1 Tax=Vitreimonas sp. TaxID=3069702 RepID=UPI002D56C19D|nr:type II toxin-antitoxin system RelE/ParE family toxin [Vitreimonas sp.]HYD87668.1 type II toxin-antitoxin system RelE/ParE family toxin [Vitreimonas sp.]
MKRIAWSEEARAELRQIIIRISDDNPFAGERVSKRIRDAVAKLRYFNSGRTGRVEGTFEKLVPKTPYIIAYVVRRTTSGREDVFIVHIIHAARDWPEGQWPG